MLTRNNKDASLGITGLLEAVLIIEVCVINAFFSSNLGIIIINVLHSSMEVIIV
jgi:hypothetical protein